MDSLEDFIFHEGFQFFEFVDSFSYYSPSLLLLFLLMMMISNFLAAQLARALEYTDCICAEE